MILDEQSQAHQAEERGQSVKRERDDDDDAPKKKAKATRSGQSLDEMSISELRTAIDAGKLGKFTVTDLKSWLSAKGLNSSGKKADLVERIEQWAEEA